MTTADQRAESEGVTTTCGLCGGFGNLLSPAERGPIAHSSPAVWDLALDVIEAADELRLSEQALLDGKTTSAALHRRRLAYHTLWVALDAWEARS